jgi:hypothetical protein
VSSIRTLDKELTFQLLSQEQEEQSWNLVAKRSENSSQHPPKKSRKSTPTDVALQNKELAAELKHAQQSSELTQKRETKKRKIVEKSLKKAKETADTKQELLEDSLAREAELKTKLNQSSTVPSEGKKRPYPGTDAAKPD